MTWLNIICILSLNSGDSDEAMYWYHDDIHGIRQSIRRTKLRECHVDDRVSLGRTKWDRSKPPSPVWGTCDSVRTLTFSAGLWGCFLPWRSTGSGWQCWWPLGQTAGARCRREGERSPLGTGGSWGRWQTLVRRGQTPTDFHSYCLNCIIKFNLKLWFKTTDMIDHWPQIYISLKLGFNLILRNGCPRI